MRIYIIGNDEITLCREPPSTVNEGEIVVASNEELHAAPLSGKRLLALWNACRVSRSAGKSAIATPDRATVVGDRGVAGPRREAPIEAGRGYCDVNWHGIRTPFSG